jgi:hypothetical protein
MPRPPLDLGVHVEHVQFESRDVKSLLNVAFRILRVPDGTIAFPKRCGDFSRCVER